MEQAEKRRVIYQSTLTGGLLGIVIGDFMIAGGASR